MGCVKERRDLSAELGSRSAAEKKGSIKALVTILVEVGFQSNDVVSNIANINSVPFVGANDVMAQNEIVDIFHQNAVFSLFLNS